MSQPYRSMMSPRPSTRAPAAGVPLHTMASTLLRLRRNQLTRDALNAVPTPTLMPVEITMSAA